MGFFITFVLAVLILGYAAFVVRNHCKRVQKGGCPGGCSGCDAVCPFKDPDESGA